MRLTFEQLKQIRVTLDEAAKKQLGRAVLIPVEDHEGKFRTLEFEPVFQCPDSRTTKLVFRTKTKIQVDL